MKDLKGKKFNYLTVIKFVGIKNKNYCWLCQCDCGKQVIVNAGNLKSGHSKSCGCYNIKRAIETNTTHNMCFTKFYKKWRGMIYRCTNKNGKRYMDWGGRGITFDKKWKTFINFKKDMHQSYVKHYKKYGSKNTTLDRIDNNGNYELSNCKWSTIKEQCNNKRPYRKKTKLINADKKAIKTNDTMP